MELVSIIKFGFYAWCILATLTGLAIICSGKEHIPNGSIYEHHSNRKF